MRCTQTNILLLTIAILAVSSCTATPRTPQEQAYIARSAYVSVLTTAVDLRAAGKINDSTYLELERIRSIAEDALNFMDLALDTNDTDEFNHQLHLFNSALASILGITKEASQ